MELNVFILFPDSTPYGSQYYVVLELFLKKKYSKSLKTLFFCAKWDSRFSIINSNVSVESCFLNIYLWCSCCVASLLEALSNYYQFIIQSSGK